MTRRMRTVTRMTAVALLLGAVGVAASASAERPIERPISKRETPMKLATRPAASVSAADAARARALFEKNTAAFAKDKDAKKFLDGGGSLGGDLAVAYQEAVARLLSSSSNGGTAAGGATGSAQMTPGSGAGAPKLTPKYALEGGDVGLATFGQPCDGAIDIGFVVKSLGSKPTSGSPRLYLTLRRADSPETIGSAWVALPALDSGLGTRVKIPGVRHRAPTPNGTCPNGTIIVTPTFLDVAAAAKYRLEIALTPTGADATLSTVPSLNFRVPPGGCPLFEKKCPSGTCAELCPPCPEGWHEVNGGCEFGTVVL